MNYADLKEIIKQLKKVVLCNNCQKKFGNEEMNLVTTFQNESLFHLNCGNCGNQLLVHVAIVSKNDASTLSIKTHQGPEISQNEALDMHNFLGQFNGDFKQLFSL
jgi:hypothetical protein